MKKFKELSTFKKVAVIVGVVLLISGVSVITLSMVNKAEAEAEAAAQAKLDGLETAKAEADAIAKAKADERAAFVADSLETVEAEKRAAFANHPLWSLTAKLDLGNVATLQPRNGLSLESLNSVNPYSYWGVSGLSNSMELSRIIFGSEADSVLNACTNNPDLFLQMYQDNQALISMAFRTIPDLRKVYRERLVTIRYLDNDVDDTILDAFAQGYSDDGYHQMSDEAEFLFASSEEAAVNYAQYKLVQRFRARAGDNADQACRVASYILKDLENHGIWEIFFPKTESDENAKEIPESLDESDWEEI